MKRRMNKDEYRKLGITAKKVRNDWSIFVNGHQAMDGLSEKDFEVFNRMSADDVITMLSRI